jgi:hypothetical protein
MLCIMHFFLKCCGFVVIKQEFLCYEYVSWLVYLTIIGGLPYIHIKIARQSLTSGFLNTPEDYQSVKLLLMINASPHLNL